MFELVFLGTSASAPSIKRGLSSLIVKHDEYRFMVDCGEGTQRQILRSGVGFKRLNHILLTHGHLDHILGLAGMLSTFMRWEAIEEVNIYGSRHTMDRVSDLINGVVLRGAAAPMPLNLLEIRPGLIFQAKHFSVQAFPVDHRGSSSLGYRFTEKSHRPFLSDAAEQLGVPNGPCRRDLVQGKAITLEDGRVVKPEDVLGKERPGVSLVIVGDVGKPEKLHEHVSGADVMVIEATYLAEDAEMARTFGHSTATEVARLAAESGVGQLILTHLSRRYRDEDVLAEARAIFPETYLAYDFDRFEVRKPGQGD
ncbi:MAG: ribonuclease Z [Anaerolineaceae bacterium]|nr:ribonuclease Z [Anaerolineaceae bacterium]MDI9531664.1 ribonuclease Z [Chloroflexota bacterium]HNZ16404.1 ribonuclease Z [Anaerolineaceae bacterium]